MYIRKDEVGDVYSGDLGYIRKEGLEMFIVEFYGIRKEGVGYVYSGVLRYIMKEGVGDVYSGVLGYKEGRGCRGS